jgi:hypothetical protein
MFVRWILSQIILFQRGGVAYKGKIHQKMSTAELK